MESSQNKGKGRARSRTTTANPPSINIQTVTTTETRDDNLSSNSSDVQPLPTSQMTNADDPPRTTTTDFSPITVEALTITEIANKNVSSTSRDVQPPSTSQITTTGGRGRGANRRQRVEVPDPHWTVSNLTMGEFKKNSRPSKPMELGKIGRQIEVIVNYYPITNFPDSGFVYQYNIEIRNKRYDEIPLQYRRNLYQCWLEQFYRSHPQFNRYKIVFDNKKIIFVYEEPLPDIDESGIDCKIMGPNRVGHQTEYQISIKRVGEPIDLSLLHSLKEFYETGNNNNISVSELPNITQVLSILLHEHCSSHADFIYNRTFFSQPIIQNKYGNWDLGPGKALWRGFYSCLVFPKGVYQLLMNLDVSHRVFTKKQPFLDFLCEVMVQSPRGRRLCNRDRNVQKLEMNDVLELFDQKANSRYYRGEIEFLLKQCRNLPVRSHVANQIIKYVIQDLGDAASTQTFKWNKKHNEFITIEKYFLEHYKIPLQYPSLPTLKMRKGSFVPMEFIDIEPVNMKKITDEQRALLCLKSSLKPYDYHQSIEEIRHNPKQQCFEEDPFLAAWNLNVDVNMLKVLARILPKPTIIFNDQYKITDRQMPKTGIWNCGSVKFYKPTRFPSVWALINLSSTLDKDACKAFYNELRNVANQRGITCPPPLIYEEYRVDCHSIDDMITTLIKMMETNDACKFFIVILPEDNSIRDRIYGDLKKLCELEFGFGIVTQMIAKKKTEKTYQWTYSKLSNILLKINTKLDGINSIIQVPENIERFFSRGHRIMYVGIDLSHAPPGSSRKRSTVAVVASADDIPNRYFKEIYVQERSSETKTSWELVKDMKPIMKSLISQYKNHRQYPPNAIVIYRDGISSSEFDTVFEEELMATREACVELSPVYRPYLTYIVVNKRHHTRFFPTEGEGNVEAGTFIDSHDVTNPGTYDFFLNSHHADKGTSRPTHYHVLYDDNKLEPDQAHMLTNALCYTSARCTRSISIPAPVKYADLLAFRASKYININDESSTNSTIPINQEIPVDNGIKSERIILSPKLDADCTFFI